MHSTLVFSSPAARSLKVRTLVAQMPVSTDGKMLRINREPAKSARAMGDRSLPTRVNPGALVPTVGSEPWVWTGVPSRVISVMQ